MNGENDEPQQKSQINEAVLRNFFSGALLFRHLPEFVKSSDLIPDTDGFTNLINSIAKPIHSDAQQPSTSTSYSLQDEDQQYIQIIIGGDENEIDADQPSTSSSLVSTQPESTQDAKIYARIRELRELGFWDSTRLPKCDDPPRRKTHWDFLLEEIIWLANDFKIERKIKRRWARQFVQQAKIQWKKIIEPTKDSLIQMSDEREAKRVCSTIARMIKEFWQNVDKVVDFRANEILETTKRKALDQHLNFLVGAADKITTLIQGRFAKSPDLQDLSSSNTCSDIDADVSNDGDGSLVTSNDEEHYDEELNTLNKEANIEMDEFLSQLPDTYLQSIGYSTIDNKLEEQSESSRIESMADDHFGKFVSSKGDKPPLDDKPDLDNVDFTKLTSENSEMRRQQLDNIAEAALVFQPRGFTLETTEVKTEIPFLICGQLREYQLVGLDWLVTLYEKNLNGILADEMGLGKTIQTIALLAHLACARAIWGPHLIIVPTSVILNWEMELKKWCPSLKVLTYFGIAKERMEKRKGWSKENAFHVCITSYKLATQDIRAFKKKAWQYVILDEAQNIKNFRSQRWQQLLGLRSRRRLLLTGTPLQNSLMELWALLHFLMPNVFASHDDFKEWFHSPITGMVEGTTEVDQALVQRLHKILRPFILRRLKSEVEKQLPTKTEKIIPCVLSKRQRFLYNEFLAKRSTMENLRSGNMLSVLSVIMQLRKCCNHPNLFEPRAVISPFVALPIANEFTPLVFSIPTQIKYDEISTLLIGNLYSSELAWKLFTEVSRFDALQFLTKNSSAREDGFLPFINGLKFVVNETGCHFFKPKTIQAQWKDEQLICNGEYHCETEIIHDTRKRRIISPISNEIKTKTKYESNQSIELQHGAKQQFDKLCIFESANEEIHKRLHIKYAENQRIGVWQSRILNSCDSPMLSYEIIQFVNQTADHPVTFFTEKSPVNKTLFDLANEQIAKNLMNWIEISMNRFLMCVHKMIIDGCFEPPIIHTFQKYRNELYNLQCKKLYAEQNHLAHKAEISSILEFPELRLIEYDCGKLQILANLLEQLYANKHRCLIFTQMSRMLDILQSFLSYHNYKYFRLDGATQIDQRQAMMERFNADESIFCFILSTRSGGIGVNLIGADTVIFYDSDWNPTMDAQAQDRCHRIGQTRDVTIYRLISERTIEENILTKSMQKRRLGEMAIDEGEFTPEFFKSANNLRELFSNEENIAQLVGPVTNKPQSSKDIEIAMLSVEDTQDVIAAQVASEETKAESAEFDENIAAVVETNEYDLRNIDSPSDQYIELISRLKPVERYAVNFLENEYRPALDKEFQETEALLRAKQMEFIGRQEDYSSDTQFDTPDITYDDELTPIFASLEMTFDEISIWMPFPSPPNSVANGGDSLSTTSDVYIPIDGASLYKPELMSEEMLPSLPPLISLNEVPPHIHHVHRPRKIPIVGTESVLSSTTTTLNSKKRQRHGSGMSNKMARDKTLMDRKDQRKQSLQQPLPRLGTSRDSSLPLTSSSAFISPPNTPMPVRPEFGEQSPQFNGTSFTQIVDERMATTTAAALLTSSLLAAPTSITTIGTTESTMLTTTNRISATFSPTLKSTANSPLCSLDEAIESTVRKNRQRQSSHQAGPISHYISRNAGPIPAMSRQRSATELNKIAYRLVCPEWRHNPSVLPMPSIRPELAAYEGGPPFSASDDLRLIEAIASKHGLLNTTDRTGASAWRLNWDFVAHFVSVGSNHYRSPRQCALRYQNYVLRCDEPLDERKAAASSSSSSRRQPKSISTPSILRSVVFDTNFCHHDLTITTRKRAKLVTEIMQNRRQLLSDHHLASNVYPFRQQSQQTPQLLCFTGRLPYQQEQRLSELGLRSGNVVRPTSVLEARKGERQK